ncbi:MAG: CBS domain-containing protein [Elusimicrobia bacterium]|nr:CBS domain-containing protein [Elusimicrobiota bacterium]
METATRLMKRKLVTVALKASAAEAARVMKKGNTGSVFVGSLPNPDGIFTERDLARKVVAEGLDPEKTPVETVMTRKLVTVDCSEPLEKVFSALAKGNFRHLPITDRGGVVGMISLTDLANVFRQLAEDEKFLDSY